MKRFRIVHLGSVVCLGLGLILFQLVSFGGTWATVDCGLRIADCGLVWAADGQHPQFTIQDLESDYHGSAALRQILEQNLAHPLALASDDFDEDGGPDLIVGYASPDGGVLTLHRGNLDSIFPNHPGARKRMEEWENGRMGDEINGSHSPTLPLSHSPFLQEANVFAVPEAPEFLGAGDFDADGHQDIVMATAGSSMLHFFLGNGRGEFNKADQIELPGTITTLATGDRQSPDGLTDIEVKILGREGPEALVLASPKGALRGEPSDPAQIGERVNGRIGEWEDGRAQAPLVHSPIPPFSYSAVAVLPMRLNGDGMSDWIILVQGQSVPLMALSSPAAVFTVTSTGDAGDSNPNDGVCNDGSGRCTLRAAIEQANASPEMDLITFNIPGAGIPTISPTRALPRITSPITLDGTTQPSGRVELNGVRAGIAVDGLTITSGNSVVRGLIINRFDKNAIKLETNGNNIIEGNYIGTDAAGMAAVGNTFDGILVSTAQNTIGGTTPAAGNVVSASGFHGIEIAGRDAAGNRVQGNYVGTNATGTAILPNGFHGIYINGAPDTTVGGPVAGARNVVSGNWDGIRIMGRDAIGNVVQGNYIGTNAAGTKLLGNSGEGVFINDGANQMIGGTTAGARNVISGNNARGVLIVGARAVGNRIQGNFIGTDATGHWALYNGSGVFVNNVSGNLIGGEFSGAGNVISGNGEGIRIAGSGAADNQIQGNLIGPDATGMMVIGNLQDGIIIQDAPDSLIGGTTPEAGNVISGNSARGVFIFGGAATGTAVQGNFIGTNSAGSAPIGNTYHGVFINGAANNTIAQNIISGNGLFGVLLYGGTATDNRVEGNFIGTDVTGTNPIGNSSGIFIAESASHNIIGPGNTVAFNYGDGIYVQSGSGNAIMSNSIFSNGAMGINLAPGGYTSNDDTPGNEDADNGPNNLQNAPMLSLGTMNDRTLTISYMVTSATRNSVYPLRIEFFKADARGQGEIYLGADMYTAADRMGTLTKTVTLTSPVMMKSGDYIVATATDKNGNTSEFSSMMTIR